ncbi:MAG TPA: SCP2 sterol-binding domain-containing protein [Myxococcota bacterium]
MSYTTTAAQFFKDTAPALVASSSLTLPAPAVFQITGSGGGTWSVDAAKKTVSEGQLPPPVSVIVKADAIDFMALVNGRMSAADGVLTGRLSLAGDAAAIATLMEALTPST